MFGMNDNNFDHLQYFSGLAQKYLDFLLQNNRRQASRLILDTVEKGVTVHDIYLKVFQPVQHEIGRLWQTNQISVAQEHFCTAATQMIMSQLYPYIFTSEKNGHKLIATCVGGELHEIGVRMVADFFEMDGWDTYYLGANTPAESIIQTIEAVKGDILAVSASMTFNINETRRLIDKVKDADPGKRVRVLVGGRPFNLAQDLWQSVNADGYAPDAQKAIQVAGMLLNKPESTGAKHANK